MVHCGPSQLPSLTPLLLAEMSDVSPLLADARDLDYALGQTFDALQNVVDRLLGRGKIVGALAGEYRIILTFAKAAHDERNNTALGDDSFTKFAHEFQDRFPRTAQRYIGGIHFALLSSFAAALPDAIPASKGELIDRLNECWRAVVLARPVLSEIASLYPKIVSHPQETVK